MIDLQYATFLNSRFFAEAHLSIPHEFIVNPIIITVLRFVGSTGGQSQLVCSGCRNLLMYPVGASSVCCAVCNAVTAVPPPGKYLVIKNLIKRFGFVITEQCRNWDGSVSLWRLPYTSNVHSWSYKCSMFLLSHR